MALGKHRGERCKVIEERMKERNRPSMDFYEA